MKTKKFNKKLELSKRTIANLSTDELKNAKGGVIWGSWDISECSESNMDSCIPTQCCFFSRPVSVCC
ncbi:MAG: class I lanthipeptide [Candidatus Aminicenantes bacterium]|nr:class I lanthipeptide [Candidatus Aminicenantes bacterium]